MNNTTKTIMIVAGSLLLVCTCCVGVFSVIGLWSTIKLAGWAENNTTRDLYEVAPMIEEIATLILPEGFGSPYGMHLGEITSVGFTSQSKNTHIMLTQFPKGTVLNTTEMVELMSKYAGDSGNRWDSSRTKVIEEKPVTIGGQETILTTSEGISSDGTPYRTAIATFQGNGGPAIVLIAGTLDEWDVDMVETFIAAIQ